MAIKKTNLFLLFPLPYFLFILGVLENKGFFSQPAVLEYTIIPVTLIAFFVYCYRKSTDFLYTSGMVFYYYIGMCISLLMVSNGVSMIEIDQIGTANGSAFMMLATCIYSITVSKISFEWAMNSRRVAKASRLSSKLINTLLKFIIAGVLCLGVIILIMYAGPVILNQNRVAFWESMSSTGLGFYPTLVIQTFYFAAYYYLFNRFHKNKPKLALIFLCGYIFITIMVLGEKFSAFIIYGSVFFALLPSFSNQLKLGKKYFVLCIVFFALLIATIVLSYITQGYDSEFIFARIALQGQLMWSIFNNSFPDFTSEQLQCLNGCNGFISGVDYMSFNFLPLTTYNHYLATSTSLSGFSPAIQFWLLGIGLTLVLQTFVSMVMGFLQAKMVIYNNEKNFVIGFFIFKLNFSIFLIWHALMFSAITGALITLTIMLLYFLASKSITRNNSKVLKDVT